MSHKATNWAIQQRGLEPATKLLLWHLSDCHNSHTGRCDPSQERLAEECEMGRASVNRHLVKLEEKGLIRRVRRINPETKRQEATFYELALDGPFQIEAVSQNDTRDSTEPCLKSEQSRVSNSAVSVSHSCETLTCKGTGNRTSNGENSLPLFSETPNLPAVIPVAKVDHFAEFWSVYPKKAGKPAAEKNFYKAVKAGADPKRIVEGARRYAAWLSSGKPGEFRPIPKFPQGWLTDQRWEDPDLWADDGEDPEVAAYRARMRAITASAQAATNRQ